MRDLNKYVYLTKVCLVIFAMQFCSCTTISPKPLNNVKWETPNRPQVHRVIFVNKDDGLYLEKNSAYNLLLNMDEMEAYQEKLELLIKTMKKYYNAK